MAFDDPRTKDLPKDLQGKIDLRDGIKRAFLSRRY